jgi:hypothetical protein
LQQGRSPDAERWRSRGVASPVPSFCFDPECRPGIVDIKL